MKREKNSTATVASRLQSFKRRVPVCVAMLYLLSSIFVSVAAADPPSPAGLGAASTVEQWGVYEIALNGPTNGNPFLEVRFSAAFSNGSKTVEMPGFYDGDGSYRVRFM